MKCYTQIYEGQIAECLGFDPWGDKNHSEGVE